MKKYFLILLMLLLSLALFGCDPVSTTENDGVTITVTPNNPDWGTTAGSGTYVNGHNILIKAEPNEGYLFVKWSDGIKDEERIINVDESCEFIAVFEPIPEPTCISSIAMNSLFYWGETDCLAPDDKISVYYDNGTVERVSVKDVEIEGFSTDEAGYAQMTVHYRGFECKTGYHVYYKSLDSSGISFKNVYALDEEIEISGYLTAYGENGKTARLSLTSEDIEVIGFDSSLVTYKDGKNNERSVTVKLSDYLDAQPKFNYTVWYSELDAVYRASLSIGEYTIDVTGFTISTDNTFELLVKKSKPSSLDNITLTEDIYETESFNRMTWELNGSRHDRIDLYYQKNALAKKVQIGYYDPTRNSLTLFAEIFDSGLMKIELTDSVSFALDKDE